MPFTFFTSSRSCLAWDDRNRIKPACRVPTTLPGVGLEMKKERLTGGKASLSRSGKKLFVHFSKARDWSEDGRHVSACSRELGKKLSNVHRSTPQYLKVRSEVSSTTVAEWTSLCGPPRTRHIDTRQTKCDYIIPGAFF